MKMLLIEGYQPLASYRNPYTYFFAQTYPLPPPSTIRGMLGRATGDYYSMFDEVEVAVLGRSRGRGWEYTSMIKLLSAVPTEGDILVEIDLGEGKKDLGFLFNKEKRARRTPVKREFLYGLDLLILLKGRDDIIEELKKALEAPKHVLYLGRAEDVLFIKEVREYTYAGTLSKYDENRGDIHSPFQHLSFYVRRDQIIERYALNNPLPTYFIPVRVSFHPHAKDREMLIHLKPSQEVQFDTVYYASRPKDVYNRVRYMDANMIEVWMNKEYTPSVVGTVVLSWL